VTLGRLVVAWLLVVLWFVLPIFVLVNLAHWKIRSADEPIPVVVEPRFLIRRSIEATLLTLIASLWFDSLGSGEWWLLFLLIGALATLSSWFLGLPRKEVVTTGLTELVRYVIAGALLAWRLS
jgi:hypothetical protein